MLIALVLMASRHEPKAPLRELKVCADPNNLPFSNQRGEGFENKIASVLGTDLGLPVRYTWWPQRRGFLRNTLNFGRCDVVLGIPANFTAVLPTRPYYRSTYVFVSRRDRGLHVRSLDDSVLHHLRIGIHFGGDDYQNPPPAEALARRGLAANVVGYSLYGDYSKPNPPADLIEAVADGAVDLGIAWGPLAGYFASRSTVPLDLTPVSPSIDPPATPFAFAIAAGVRRGDDAMRDRVQGALDRHRAEIHDILESYGVPLVGDAGN
jgi:quinoprotein dehydrogenase-associated probable ABC transporter substrate-binding protein